MSDEFGPPNCAKCGYAHQPSLDCQQAASSLAAPVVGRRRKFTMTADYGTTTRNAMCYDFCGVLAFVEYELAHGAESVTATVHWMEPPNG